MSKISDITIEIIHNYILSKRGNWDKKEAPPEQTFLENEIYCIGEKIVSKLEGLLADNYLGDKKVV